MIDFYKYQGAGNDFILIDNRQNVFTGDKVALAKKWCARRFGIGSDGLIFIEKDADTAFLMDFYNPDGSQSFCGNGSRCAIAFAHFLKIFDAKGQFKAIDGIHEAVHLSNGQVKIGMHQYGAIERVGNDYYVDTGSPHYLSYEQEEADERSIVTFGREVRYSPAYAVNGVNVNLITPRKKGKITVRTYERGVENETLACGTGATACGLSYADLFLTESEGVVDVAVKGGDLKIHFTKESEGLFKDIWLEGPAVFVFKGRLDV